MCIIRFKIGNYQDLRSFLYRDRGENLYLGLFPFTLLSDSDMRVMSDSDMRVKETSPRYRFFCRMTMNMSTIVVKSLCGSFCF